jgi:hypothetical protein
MVLLFLLFKKKKKKKKKSLARKLGWYLSLTNLGRKAWTVRRGTSVGIALFVIK